MSLFLGHLCNPTYRIISFFSRVLHVEKQLDTKKCLQYIVIFCLVQSLPPLSSFEMFVVIIFVVIKISGGSKILHILYHSWRLKIFVHACPKYPRLLSVVSFKNVNCALCSMIRWFIGVFPKWSRTFTEFRETDKSLKYDSGSI